MAGETRVVLGGDVMLGRLVAAEIRARDPAYPLGALAPLMAKGLTVVNLECAITATHRQWTGTPKAFYFGAPPEAVASLTAAGVDMVSLANNHILDFGEDGLRDTLALLQEQGIAHTGAGTHLAEALAPAIVERNGIRFGMVAFCNHQEDFAAGEHTPGMAYLDLDDETGTLRAFREGLERMRTERVDWPILSLHWGSNWARAPSPYFVRLAHAAIDMGYALLFGHSAHLFQGVEVYRGRPILYAAGDLVDDYYVDPVYRNDQQLLFELLLTGTEVTEIRLHPVFITDCHTVPATGEIFDAIVETAIQRCAAVGSRVRRRDGRVWIDLKHRRRDDG